MKKRLRIVFVDDDDTRRRQLREWADRRRHEYSVRVVESVYDAAQLNADVYVIDVTSVCPLSWSLAPAYAPIAKLMSMHESAEFLVTSAMSKNLIDDLNKDVQAAAGRPLVYAGLGGFDGIEKALQEITKGN